MPAHTHTHTEQVYWTGQLEEKRFRKKVGLEVCLEVEASKRRRLADDGSEFQTVGA